MYFADAVARMSVETSVETISGHMRALYVGSSGHTYKVKWSKGAGSCWSKVVWHSGISLASHGPATLSRVAS